MNLLKLLISAVSTLPEVVQGIESLDASKPGGEKRIAAIEIVATAIGIADPAISSRISDKDGFRQGLGKIVDGIVQCLNASVWHKP